MKLDLLKTLVQRDLEARYKGSVLGNAWAILHQLAQLLVYTYLFSIVLKVKLSLRGLPTNEFTFGLWLFAGLIPWTAFVAGLSGAVGSVIGQPNLIKKVVFPLALLPLVPICTALVESSFGMMLLITFMAISAKTIHSTVWLLPVVLLPQLLFTAGLGYLFAGLTVFLRDIPQTIAVLLSLWFYVTPIVYPASLIPEAWRFWVFWFNPMTAIVEVYRDVFLVGEMKHWHELGVLWAIAVVAFALGFGVYRRLRPAFADVV
ncbi:ABC transporter permease [Leptolyngbya sp. AS-A5]|nr:ABC transporter permease [Leptolyngbya sp. FACHB-17]